MSSFYHGVLWVLVFLWVLLVLWVSVLLSPNGYWIWLSFWLWWFCFGVDLFDGNEFCSVALHVQVFVNAYFICLFISIVLSHYLMISRNFSMSFRLFIHLSHQAFFTDLRAMHSIASPQSYHISIKYQRRFCYCEP